MNNQPFVGAYTALITPFRDGEIDEDSLRTLVQRQLAGGIDGLCPCGTTGECATMSVAEHRRVFDIVIEEVQGRIPVVAGVGTNDTQKSIKLAKEAQAAGADGLLIVVPYYNKPSQEGVEAHFRAILTAVPLPAILYDIPGRSVISLELATLGRLLDLENVVAVKDASGNVNNVQAMRVHFGDRITVLSGDDGLTVPMMSVGASGVISVTSNAFPAEVKAIVKLAAAGDYKAAAAAHLRLLPTHQAMFIEPNPGPVKALLAHAGHIAPEVRLPMVMPQESSVEHVLAITQAAGLTP